MAVEKEPWIVEYVLEDQIMGMMNPTFMGS